MNWRSKHQTLAKAELRGWIGIACEREWILELLAIAAAWGWKRHLRVIGVGKTGNCVKKERGTREKECDIKNNNNNKTNF